MVQCIRCRHEFAVEELSPGKRCIACLTYARKWQATKYAKNEAYREHKKLYNRPYKRARYRKEHPGSRHYTKHVDVTQT